MHVAHGDGAALEVGLLDDTSVGRGDARAGLADVWNLQDDHVAAVAAALLQQPPSRGACLLRRDDLEEGLAHREHRILQAELADARIVVGVVEAEDSTDVGLRCGKILTHQGDLSKAHWMVELPVVG